MVSVTGLPSFDPDHDTDLMAVYRTVAGLGDLIHETHPRPGDTRACPDCRRPQHYTGTELGWCHDAAVDTRDCADPSKAGA